MIIAQVFGDNSPVCVEEEGEGLPEGGGRGEGGEEADVGVGEDGEPGAGAAHQQCNIV